MSLQNARPICLDELPAYSPWIHFLLGLKTLSSPLEKTPENIMREFGKDKWGILLDKLKAIDSPSVLDADRLNAGVGTQAAFYAKDKLYVANINVVQDAYFDFILHELQPALAQAGHLVELGAGYGGLMFKLAALPGFQNYGFTAAEYTATGIACMNLLAHKLHLKLETGYCDLSDLSLSAFNIPEKAVFLTCWTMACLKGFPRSTLNELIFHGPTMVIHIEPIYEYYDGNSLLHMLWKRYLQLNNYNQSMLSALKEYEAEGLIEVIEERPNLFGNNPLAPVSVIKWRPRVV